MKLLPTALQERLNTTQDCLTALVAEARNEGFDVEIYARQEESGMTWNACLTRRVFAERRRTSTLKPA